jgi:branched-subunit amino acid aminotransferase/4-amino-4-deoxychorismate lyase
LVVSSFTLCVPDLAASAASRVLASAKRLALPGFDEAELLACLRAFVRVESDAGWLPSSPGCSLYLRPTVMATTPFLGVGAASEAVLFVIASPCGPYLSGPARAVTLALEEEVVRAAPGGVGNVKVGGNYAPTILPAVQAAARCGAAQVLYTYAPPGGGERVISEAGAMNVFFLLRESGGGCELVTPPLDGTILPGVTRRSVLELASDACGRGTLASQPGGTPPGLRVSERPLSVSELAAAAQEDRLLEVFCTGTAATVLPVQCIVRSDGEQWLAQPFDAAPGATLSGAVAAALAAVQRGEVAGHEWSVTC